MATFTYKGNQVVLNEGLPPENETRQLLAWWCDTAGGGLGDHRTLALSTVFPSVCWVEGETRCRVKMFPSIIEFMLGRAFRQISYFSYSSLILCWCWGGRPRPKPHLLTYQKGHYGFVVIPKE